MMFGTPRQLSVSPSWQLAGPQGDKGSRRGTIRAVGVSGVIACCLVAASLAAAVDKPADAPGTMPDKGPAAGARQASNLYIEIRLNKPAKLAALKPGDIIEGALSRDVYSGNHQIFASGSTARLTVAKMERRRKEPDARWPALIRLFMARHEDYPSFQSATVSLSNGAEVPLQVSLVSASYRTELRASAKSQRKTAQQRLATAARRNPEEASEAVAEPRATSAEDNVRGTRSARKARSTGQTMVLAATGVNPRQMGAPQPTESPSTAASPSGRGGSLSLPEPAHN